MEPIISETKVYIEISNDEKSKQDKAGPKVQLKDFLVGLVNR